MSRRSVLAYWNRSSSPSISMALASHIRSVRCICRTVPARCGRTLVCDPAVPTLYKAVVFSVWVGVFSLLEATVHGLLHRQGLLGGFEEIASKGRYELLAGCVVTFVAFIPFFAFKEAERVLGEGTLRALFWRRVTPGADSPCSGTAGGNRS